MIIITFHRFLYASFRSCRLDLPTVFRFFFLYRNKELSMHNSYWSFFLHSVLHTEITIRAENPWKSWGFFFAKNVLDMWRRYDEIFRRTFEISFILHAHCHSKNREALWSIQRSFIVDFMVDDVVNCFGTSSDQIFFFIKISDLIENIQKILRYQNKWSTFFRWRNENK